MHIDPMGSVRNICIMTVMSMPTIFGTSSTSWSIPAITKGKSAAVGPELGTEVGILDGDVLGFNVGLLLGDTLGRLDGDSEGDVLGAPLAVGNNHNGNRCHVDLVQRVKVATGSGEGGPRGEPHSVGGIVEE